MRQIADVAPQIPIPERWLGWALDSPIAKDPTKTSNEAFHPNRSIAEYTLSVLFRMSLIWLRSILYRLELMLRDVTKIPKGKRTEKTPTEAQRQHADTSQRHKRPGQSQHPQPHQRHCR